MFEQDSIDKLHAEGMRTTIHSNGDLLVGPTKACIMSMRDAWRYINTLFPGHEVWLNGGTGSLEISKRVYLIPLFEAQNKCRGKSLSLDFNDNTYDFFPANGDTSLFEKAQLMWPESRIERHTDGSIRVFDIKYY